MSSIAFIIIIHDKDFNRNCSVHEGFKISFCQQGCWFKGLYMVSLLFEIFKKNVNFWKDWEGGLRTSPPPESAYEF